MSEIGYIKIHRQIRDHWIWDHPQKLKWWLDILMMANFKENKCLIGNELQEIKRGTFHTSELKLSSRWGVSRRTVATFLNLLENDEMIEQKKSKNGTTIKVLNYNDYQDFSNEKRTTNDTTNVADNCADNSQIIAHENRTSNKVNKDKKEKNKDNSGRFTPPTLEEVNKYCEDRKNGIDAQRFIDFYSSKGWMIGKNKMKDWKACVRTWENKNRQSNTVKGYSNEEEPDPF